jgi:hypothetical protein
VVRNVGTIGEERAHEEIGSVERARGPHGVACEELLYPVKDPVAIDRHPGDLLMRHLTAAYAGCRLEAGAGSSASLVISDHQCRRCCKWSRL